MSEQKYVVEYSLAYDYTVRVGVTAASVEDAKAKAGAAFDAGTIWDDTPDMPLLYDEYDEQEDNTLEFFATAAGETFPKVDGSVLRDRGRQKAIDAANLLIAAYEHGEANGKPVDMGMLDTAYEAALVALRDLGYRKQTPKQEPDAGTIDTHAALHALAEVMRKYNMEIGWDCDSSSDTFGIRGGRITVTVNGHDVPVTAPSDWTAAVGDVESAAKAS